MIEDYALGVLASLAYGVVGLLLLAVGYGLVDLLTPGNLARRIWQERNVNVAIVLVSGLIGTTLIVVTAVAGRDDDLAAGLLLTGMYGLLGLALMGVSFLVLDAVTPGRLGVTLTDPTPQPAAWVTAVVHIAVGAIMAAAIS